MRVNGKKTIVYTKTGNFIKIDTPAPAPVIGQTVEISERRRGLFKYGSLLKYVSTAAALFIILTLGLIHPLVWTQDGAVAAVEMNINNGLSLQVDKNGKVTEVRSVWPEKDSAVDELPLKGMDVYQAVKLVVEDAGENGDFSHEQSVVMVSVVPASKKNSEIVDHKKMRGVVHDELVRQGASSIVMVAKPSWEDGSKAKKMGMTVNNYLVYERCRKGGLDVKEDVFRGRNVREAINESNVSLVKLFPEETLEVKGQRKGHQKEVIVYSQPVPESDIKGEESQPRRVQPGSRGGSSRGEVRMHLHQTPAQGVKDGSKHVSENVV